MEVFGLFQNLLHPQTVELFVSLGPRGADRRPLAHVQDTKLNAGRIDILRHFAAEGVDLPDEMPFGLSANRWIAGHQGDRIQINRQQQGFLPHTCRRQRRFTTGMAGPDDNHVIMLVVKNHCFVLFSTTIIILFTAG